MPIHKITTLATTSILGLLAACSTPAPTPATPPNIVFVLLDDVRWDALGAGGHPWAQTPNFDRVAREGT